MGQLTNLRNRSHNINWKFCAKMLFWSHNRVRQFVGLCVCVFFPSMCINKCLMCNGIQKQKKMKKKQNRFSVGKNCTVCSILMFGHAWWSDHTKCYKIMRIAPFSIYRETTTMEMTLKWYHLNNAYGNKIFKFIVSIVMRFFCFFFASVSLHWGARARIVCTYIEN